MLRDVSIQMESYGLLGVIITVVNMTTGEVVDTYAALDPEHARAYIDGFMDTAFTSQMTPA